MLNKQRFLLLILLLALAYILMLQAIAIWGFTIDDMYITLRYAKNLAAGKGLLWNIGEEPVEGYSNFSFVLLAASALRWGLDPVIALKLSGIAGMFFALLALFLLSRFWTAACLAFIPSLWLLLYKSEIIWAVSGLETCVYQALLALGLYCLLRGIGYRAAPLKRTAPLLHFTIIAAVLFFLAGLTRPEAPVIIALFYSIALLDKSPQSKRSWPLEIWLSALIFTVLYLPYFLWRWHYFGFLFPNPVYCKGMNPQYQFSIDMDYLKLAWPFALLALPAIFSRSDKRHYYFWLPSIAYLILLYNADPVSAFLNRLFLPAFLLLLPLSLAGLDWLAKKFASRQPQVYAAIIVLGVFWITFFFIPKTSLSGLRFFSQNPKIGNQLRSDVAQWVTNNTQTNDTIVLADSGLIPYQNIHNRFIDSYCLNNKDMALLPEATRYLSFCEQLLKSKPDVIILTSLTQGNKHLYTPADQCLSSQLEHSQQYSLMVSLQVGDEASFYRYEIYQLLKKNTSVRPL